MEENREMWSQEEKRGEKMIMEIDVIAQVTALRISELLRTINGKQRGYSTKLNRQKKKSTCAASGIFAQLLQGSPAD